MVYYPERGIRDLYENFKGVSFADQDESKKTKKIPFFQRTLFRNWDSATIIPY